MFIMVLDQELHISHRKHTKNLGEYAIHHVYLFHHYLSSSLEPLFLVRSLIIILAAFGLFTNPMERLK